MTLTRSARFGAAALLMAGAAGAQTRPGGSGIPVSKDAPASDGSLNEKYMTNIMAGGDSLEIQLGHLAHAKGTAQSVRNYGLMLANDHTAHLAKVIEVIADEDVGTAVPPTNVEGDRTRAMLTWLQNTPASKEWDAAYLRFQAQHHQNVYDLLSANSKEAHDDDLEQIVRATLNSLIKHRDTAKSAATSLGVMVH